MSGTEASDLFDASSEVTYGLTSSYTRAIHLQGEVNGQPTDYVVVAGGQGIEFYSMNPDTGILTLENSNYDLNDNGFSYEDPEYFSVNGEHYVFASFDTNDSSSPNDANVTFKLNQSTGAWEIAAAQTDDDLKTGTATNSEKNASGIAEVFQGADGNAYMWFSAGTRQGRNGDSFIEKQVWDAVNEQWVPTGETIDNTSNTTLLADVGLKNTSTSKNSMEIVQTSDGLKMIMAGGNTGTSSNQISVIDLDENGNLTGNFTVHNMPSGYDPHQFLQNVDVDPNGNIFMAGGSHASANGGIYVLDPTGQTVIAQVGTGEGDREDNTTGIGAIGRDASVSFQDGYIYITSEQQWTDYNIYTIILNQSDYSIVDQGDDLDAGRTDFGGTSFTMIETVTGNSFMLEISQEDANTRETQLHTFALTGDAAPCFVAGSKIRTAWGDIAVEDLIVGDLVETLDHGTQPIRWIGKRRVRAIGKTAPILFKAGAVGNERDLWVSPNHRMLIEGWRAELVYGERRILVSAKDLVNDHNILSVAGGFVEYYHILFDQHEIVFAEGCPSESFHPGQVGLNAFENDQLEELLELFPELENRPESFGASAYPSLKKYEAHALFAHVKLDNLSSKN